MLVFCVYQYSEMSIFIATDVWREFVVRPAYVSVCLCVCMYSPICTITWRTCLTNLNMSGVCIGKSKLPFAQIPIGMTGFCLQNFDKQRYMWPTTYMFVKLISFCVQFAHLLGGKCYHICPNKVCLPKASVCDGILDCKDRSDELNCTRACE